jgi:protein-disulfide isomerase
MRDLRSAPAPPLHAGDHVRGPADAPLVIIYGEFTCPQCALAHVRLRDVPVLLVFRHFALRSKPRAVALAQAAEAAAAQGRFWELHDALFADQGRQDDPHLWAHAERLGLDVKRFERDRRGPAAAARVTSDTRTGMRAGVASTPALLLGERLVHGPPDVELLAEISAAASEAERE